MSRFVPNPVAIRATSVARGTELVRGVINDTIRGGKHLARRGDHRHGSGRPVVGRRLADSFGQRWDHGHEMISAEAFNDRPYAASMALGSQAHIIQAKSRRLKFQWARGDASPRLRRRRSRDGFFYFKRVYHPGNKRPNRFLQAPFAMAARKHGFRVTIVSNSRGFLP